MKNFQVILMVNILGSVVGANAMAAPIKPIQQGQPTEVVAFTDKSLTDKSEQLDLFTFAAEGKLNLLQARDSSRSLNLGQVNDAGDTLLHVAVAGEQVAVVEWLLKKKAPVNFQNGAGETSLHLALRGDNPKIAEMLLRSGADVSIRTLADKATVLHLAGQKNNLELIRSILRKDKKLINVQDLSGQTALHKAASVGGTKIIPYLLKFGANPSLKDQQGKTPMDLAQEANLKETVKLLRKSQ